MHHATIKRIITYRRVAANDQTSVGNSLDAQGETLARYAASLGLPIALDFVEVASGAGGKKARRVEQERLLEALRHGDLVAVATVDRLGRGLDVVKRRVGRILSTEARFVSVAEGEFDRSHAGAFTFSLLTLPAQKG
jgi:DNA invertase Pin-like site-specific DNA recombinase